jgi:hypothetical protein
MPRKLKGIDYSVKVISNDFWKDYLFYDVDISLFTNLEELHMSELDIPILPLRLPITLKKIKCNGNLFTTIDKLSNLVNLEELDCSYNSIKTLNALPSNLKVLICNGNKISSFDNLPAGLKKLSCYGQQKCVLKLLDNLPIELEELNCNSNQELLTLDNLPQKLKKLDCNNCWIKNLNNLPDSIEELYCHNNHITSFAKLPANLRRLSCVSNPLEYDFIPTIRNIKIFISTT